MSPGIAVAAALAGAVSPEMPPPVLWHVQVDNDVAFHTDRWYSSGVRVYRSASLEGGEPLASVLRAPATRSQRLDVGVIQEVYTGNPYAAPADTDRPNAGRLLVSAARHDIAPDALVTLGVDAGVSGPSARGEEAQRFIHRFVTAPETDWSSQVPDRADVQLVGAWSKGMSVDGLPGKLVLHGGAVAGTLTAFGHAGVEWRSDGPAEAASPLLRYAATPPLQRPEGGLGFFAGAGVRGVARNRLLERRADDARAEPSAETWVARIAAGISWSAPWGTATFGIAQDSREFEGQSAPHRFGTLTVSLRLD